jgi:2C-methyl-D-erythritol 2,4-cyclodiphosphate synthase
VKRPNNKTKIDSSDHSGAGSVEENLDIIYSAATDWRVGLERTQRILLGLDDEPMVFDEGSIAQMLKAVASDHDGMSDEFMVLHAVANALLGVDDNFKLKLSHKKRGKFMPPNVREAELARSISILKSVQNLKEDGWKTEAAIAQMQEHLGISRATVFADIKAAEEFLQIAEEIAETVKSKNPKSNHSEK